MEINAAVWNFGGQNAEVIDRLHTENILNVKFWCSQIFVSGSSQNLTIFDEKFLNGCSLSNEAMALYKKYSTHLQKDCMYYECYNAIRNKALLTFMDMYSRQDFAYQRLNYYSLLGLFNVFFDTFYGLLKKEHISLVLFGDVPNGGHDYLLYEIARWCNIKTALFTAGPVAGKSLYATCIEDFGEFPDLKQIRELVHYKIPKKISSPYYMANCFQPKISKLKTLWRLIWASSYKKMCILKQYHGWKRYSDNLRAIAKCDVDMNSKYIYFALHLQPEMTTNALGNVYCDQILAVEHLSSILPEGWKIFVKENPKQSEFMRDDVFFQRVLNLSNVIFLNAKVNTFDLIKHASAVATITGTVGWEAIQMGVPAIVFGYAWYSNLEGVYKFNVDMNIKEICSKMVDLNKVEIGTQELLSRLLDFSVDANVECLNCEEQLEFNKEKFFLFIKNEIVKLM